MCALLPPGAAQSASPVDLVNLQDYQPTYHQPPFQDGETEAQGNNSLPQGDRGSQWPSWDAEPCRLAAGVCVFSPPLSGWHSSLQIRAAQRETALLKCFFTDNQVKTGLRSANPAGSSSSPGSWPRAPGSSPDPVSGQHVLVPHSPAQTSKGLPYELESSPNS